MYPPKEKIVSEEEMQEKTRGLQVMQAMSMNRAERRALSKANNGLRIPGSTKPVVNTKKK